MKKILLIILLLIVGCENKSDKKEIQQRQNPPIEVNVIEIKPKDENLSINYPAKIQSTTIFINPEINGILEKTFIKAGQKVKKDEPLFEIKADKIKANLELAKANLNANQVNFENIKKEFDRAKILFKSKASSLREFNNVKAKYDRAFWDNKIAKENFKIAQIDLDSTIIKAPFDGILGEDLAKIGQKVLAFNTNLISINKESDITAKFYVSDLDKLQKINKDVELNFEGKKTKGKLIFLDNKINGISVLAKASFENSLGLLDGSFGNVILNFTEKNVSKIPLEYILQDELGAYIFTANKDLAEKQRIEILQSNDNFAFVKGAIKNKIIINNFQKIRQGSKIKEAKNNV